jgi:hypothetical protein
MYDCGVDGNWLYPGEGIVCVMDPECGGQWCMLWTDSVGVGNGCIIDSVTGEYDRALSCSLIIGI